MKKIIRLALLLVTMDAWAQESSVQLSFGYGIPLASQQIYTNSNFTISSDNSAGVYGSYGSGFTVSGSFTRMFTPSLGLDLAGTYLFGNEYHGTNTATFTTSTSVTKGSASASGFMICPSFVIRAGEAKFKPYMKAGVVIGFMSMFEISDNTTSGSGTNTTQHSRVEFTGGSSFGVRGAVGVAFGINTRMSIFAEVAYTAMSYFPSEGELTEAVLNGVNQLPSLSVSNRKLIFKSEISQNPTAIPDSTKPVEVLKTSFAMSSIGLNAGVKYRLGAQN